MSPITKLFVVLHVILSMLLTAGVVVFVNRVDQYNMTVAGLTTKLGSANAAAQASKNEASSAKDALNQANILLAAQIQQAQAERLNLSDQLAHANVQLAELNKQLSIAQADTTTMAQGMKASQAAQTAMASQVTELRSTVDRLTKDKQDLDLAVADLTSQRDVLERQRRDLAEKVSSIQNELDADNKVITENNLKPAPAHFPGMPSAEPPINGVVREVHTIEHIPYATISVGSADAVTKGMEFKVVDRNKGDFLGTLKVETVEPNEAAGRLEGPGIDRIRPGVEVRTQL